MRTSTQAESSTHVVWAVFEPSCEKVGIAPTMDKWQTRQTRISASCSIKNQTPYATFHTRTRQESITYLVLISDQFGCEEAFDSRNELAATAGSV